jgi:hypothetical protein
VTGGNHRHRQLRNGEPLGIKPAASASAKPSHNKRFHPSQMMRAAIAAATMSSKVIIPRS